MFAYPRSHSGTLISEKYGWPRAMSCLQPTPVIFVGPCANAREGSPYLRSNSSSAGTTGRLDQILKLLQMPLADPFGFVPIGGIGLFCERLLAVEQGRLFGRQDPASPKFSIWTTGHVVTQPFSVSTLMNLMALDLKWTQMWTHRRSL